MKMVKTTFSVTLLSFLLISCGDESIRPAQKSFDLSSQILSSNLTFSSLNTSVSTNFAASGSLRIDGGKLLVQIESDGLSPNSRHVQIIYSKTGCPTDTDDANGDGFIDYQEAIGSSSVISPLTNDLTEEGDFPVADETGKYQYSASGDSTLDKDSLEGRAIIIHGVSESQTLPDTVASAQGLTSHESLPIACSVIEFEEEDQSTTGGTTGDTTGDSTGDMTTGDHEQTTGKGGYQEQTTGKGGYQEQITGKGGYQEQTTGKGGYQEQTTGHHQQQQQQQQQQQTVWN